MPRSRLDSIGEVIVDTRYTGMIQSDRCKRSYFRVAKENAFQPTFPLNELTVRSLRPFASFDKHRNFHVAEV